MIQRSDGRVVLGGMRWLSPTRERNTLNDQVVAAEISSALRQYLIDNFPLKEEQKVLDSSVPQQGMFAISLSLIIAFLF